MHLNKFIQQTEDILGYEVETLHFKEYKDNAWYYEGYNEYCTFDDFNSRFKEEYFYKCTISPLGVAVQYFDGSEWFNYTTLDIEYDYNRID
jgi:hypothetical protein